MSLSADATLSFAFQRCHKGSRKNKRRILIYLIPVKMLLVSEPFCIRQCGVKRYLNLFELFIYLFSHDFSPFPSKREIMKYLLKEKKYWRNYNPQLHYPQHIYSQIFFFTFITERILNQNWLYDFCPKIVEMRFC